jgi:Na+-driven multidrug efflux pump
MNITRITFLAASVLLIPVTVLAAQLYNPIQTTDLSTFLAKLLDLVVMIVFPLIVLFIVYIGFLFVSSQGNPEKLKEAREYFFWALVGALIVLGAQALSLAIKATVDQL